MGPRRRAGEPFFRKSPPPYTATTEKRTKNGEDENKENNGGEIDNIRGDGSHGCHLCQPIANWSPLDSGEMEGAENNKWKKTRLEEWSGRKGKIGPHLFFNK